MLKIITKKIKAEVSKDGNKIGVVFRYPTVSESIELLGSLSNMSYFIIAVNKLFVEFSSKPKVQDDNEKEIEIKDFKDLMDLPTNDIILLNLLTEVGKEFRNALEEGAKVEKKSK